MRNEQPETALPMDTLLKALQAIEQQKMLVKQLATSRQPVAEAWTRLVELEETLERLYEPALTAGQQS